MVLMFSKWILAQFIKKKISYDLLKRDINIIMWNKIIVGNLW